MFDIFIFSLKWELADEREKTQKQLDETEQKLYFTEQKLAEALQALN